MKNKYFKTSHIKKLINIYFIRFLLSFFKFKFKPQGKVLIKSNDGIGDFILRSKLLKLIEEKYGKENIYVLVKKNFISLPEMFGYKSIGYDRKDRKNFFRRLKKMYTINKIGFSVYINLEYEEDIDDVAVAGNLFALEKIGIKNIPNTVEVENTFYTKPFPLKSDYVLKQVVNMAKGILNIDTTVKEMTPDLRYMFDTKAKENIVVGIGSSAKFKTCSPILMASYLKEVKEKYPEQNIILLGNGEHEKKYARKIIEILGEKNIVDMVDKTSFYEAFDFVAKSFLFIGFDSGLYNAAFALRKKAIVIFRQRFFEYEHVVPWINIVIPKKVRTDIIDEEYPNFEINSVTVEDFKEVLEKVDKTEKIIK